ncbi:MBL fold metallo-hydrolase [Halomicroarcula limicola]|uniref:MBL fold metallo-hydrolase n=1 Tax=Haloarcula limicola TaxID=1429915 RepID=A0A8J8C8D9_9EURY|nr:MBL fold metallo-hydrolase [Halomicroarcula limicola]MBV0925978.1 MBL fold metallo-hydrolase [Halomicroarcula limicola]
MNPFRIAHSHGSPEGENSAYVFPERGVVIDPGPPGDEPWEVLRDGLEAYGLEVADVEDVVLTHWHSDHAGLGPRLATAADAALHMHERDAPLIRDYGTERRRRVERDAETLTSWGVPERIVSDVRDSDTPSPMPDSVPVVGHEDGDSVADLELKHTPGHTRGHVAVRAERTLYVGDAVLPMYTPNVGGSDTRTAAGNPLETYLRTLDRIGDWNVEQTARPGHGPLVSLDDRIAVIRAHHRERIADSCEAIPDGEAVTPWTVARTLFGEMSGIHAKMGAGEAAAHLTHAAKLGLVERTDERPHRYRTTGESLDDVPQLSTGQQA